MPAYCMHYYSSEMALAIHPNRSLLAMADLTRPQLVSDSRGIFAKNESEACRGLDPTRSEAPDRM